MVEIEAPIENSELTADPELAQPNSIAVCLTCGMIASLIPAYEAMGRAWGDAEHTCEWTSLPTEQGLQIAALLEDSSKEKRLPRCADCGGIAPSIWSFSEGKARCKPCAQSNWKSLWAESVDTLVEDSTNDPIEQILRYGRFSNKPDDARREMVQVARKGRPRAVICLPGQRCELCGNLPAIVYNHNETWRCKDCIVRMLEIESGSWATYVSRSDPYEAATGHPVRKNRRLLAAWRAAEHITVVRLGIDS